VGILEQKNGQVHWMKIEYHFRQNAGTSRGSVSFSVPHNTTVSVINSKTADDARRWYKVEYKGNIG